MGDRTKSMPGFPEQNEGENASNAIVRAERRGPSVVESAEQVTDPSALKVVPQPDEAELETDSSARSVYEFLSEGDVEEVRDSSVSKTDTRPGFSGTTDPQRSKPPSRPEGPFDERVGQDLSGRYQIERLIGKGGMGRVYLAKQTLLNRMVAIKILNRSFQNKDPQFSERFYLEAATAARLNHPNSITVFDYGETDAGELYIVMEYLKGLPLSRVINRNGPMNVERTIRIALHLCRALRAAHKKGIIHRDLKPGNIMLLDQGDDPEMAKVLDFGLVKLFQNTEQEEDPESPTPVPLLDQELTHAGMFLGSPKYMSPEQIQNADLDPRTDIYSLGIILFYMLAGRQPYIGKGSIDIVYQHIHAPLPTLNQVNPDVVIPEELEAVVRKCLEKDREDRFSSMSELLNRLLEILGNVSNSSTPLLLSDTSEASSSLSVAPFSNRDSAKAETPEPTLDSLHSNKPNELSGSVAQLAQKSTLSFVLMVGLAVLGFGGAAYWFIAGQSASGPNSPSLPSSKAGQNRVPAPTKNVVQIQFTSEPSGVSVKQGQKVLGETPFSIQREVTTGSSKIETYLFSKPGYTDRELERTISNSDLKVFTRLEPLPGHTPSRSKAKKLKRNRKTKSNRKKDNDEDYKDNPY